MLGKHHSLWADQRLAEAADLIEAVAQDHSTANDKLPEISGLIHEISKADDFLAGALCDRKSAADLHPDEDAGCMEVRMSHVWETLKSGHTIVVSNEDAHLLTEHKWRVWTARSRNFDRPYVRTIIDGKSVALHRLIMGAGRGQIVDHVDGNALNNTRENLRICSQSENVCNARSGGNLTGFRGVRRIRSNRYGAAIMAKGVEYKLGVFDRAEDAARAYDAASVIHHGQYGRRNFGGAA